MTFRIVIDTREQAEYSFSCETIRKKLDAGDYSVVGHETRVAVERKSLADFVHTVIHDFPRFGRELDKLAQLEAACVVVEADLDAVLRGKAAGVLRGVSPRSVLGAAVHVAIGYGVPVYWCGSRQAAGKRLLGRGAIVAVDSAITDGQLLESEQSIADTFRRWAWTERPLEHVHADVAGLKPGQVDACRLALRYPMVTISGAAGTGKSLLLARLARAFHAAGLDIALCAPTGKAAKRIEESLRLQGLELEAKTAHRLLEYDGRQFNASTFSYDVVAVDEMSMTDVFLMAELLRRVDFTKTRLILLGDHNQLPPVGPGNVLRDIVQHSLVPTVILDEVVRQAGVLKTNCTAILDGRLVPSAANDTSWTVIDSFSEAQQIQVYLRDLVLERIPKRLGLDPVQDVQILTPTHLGPLGTKAINRMMQHVLQGETAHKFAVGDKVI